MTCCGRVVMLSRSYFIPRSTLSCWLSIPKSEFRWVSFAGRLRAAEVRAARMSTRSIRRSRSIGMWPAHRVCRPMCGSDSWPATGPASTGKARSCSTASATVIRRNRADCLEKLRQLILAVRHAPVRRRRTDPTRASRERRLRTKQHTAEKKRSRHGPAAGD